MSMYKITPVTVVAFLAVAAPACWTIVSPQPGYKPHTEEPPCTAGAGNGCSEYYVCQPDSLCKNVKVGFHACTEYTVNRPMRKYSGGAINAFTGCCVGTAANYIVLDQTRTCANKLALPGMGGCAVAEPYPS